MKNLTWIIVFAAVMMLGACGNRNSTLTTDMIDNPNSASGRAHDKLPKIEFVTDMHDFGKVVEGEKLTYSFKFKNTGKTNLIIANADASCGCTVPSFPSKPIAPGQEDFITVTFNSDGKLGFNHKTVTIVSNCQPNTTVLHIKATVETAR